MACLRHALFPLQSALAAKRDGGGVFTLFPWRRLTIFNLASQDIDHEFGKLVCVTGALLTSRFVGRRHLQAPTDALRVLRCL